MAKQIIFLIIFSITAWFISSCQQDGVSDPLYPSVVETLTDNQIENLYSVIGKSSLYGCSLLDDFGHFKTNLKDKTLCTLNDSTQAAFTKFELDSLAKLTAIDFESFLEVEDTAKLRIKEIRSYDGILYDNFKDSLASIWKVSFYPQSVDGMNVRGTDIVMYFDTLGLFAIYGNWYKDIYVPVTDKVSVEDAKKLLYNIKLTYKTASFTPTSETEWRRLEKVIVPIHRSGKIELRVCWDMYTDAWEILVDSQDGERLSVINFNVL